MDVTKLNEEQALALAEFRDAVQDCKMRDSSDVYLLRWLIARDFSVERAEKMLRASLEWRRQYRIDTLLQDFESPEVFKQYYASGLVGVDKAHNPLWIVRYGKIDMKGILRSAKKRDYLYYVYSLVESSIQSSMDYKEEHNLPASFMPQSTIIFDLEDLAMKHITYKPAMDAAIQVVQFYEANYPEYLRRVFVINAPRIFNLAFAIIRPFLNEATANKVRIVGGSDGSQWAKTLLEEIDADQLPAHYGGTMTDPDGNPECITKVCKGGLVPESFYFSNVFNEKSKTNKKKLPVSYGAKERLEFDVKVPGSMIQWEFYSEGGDIAFAIYKKNAGDKSVMLPKDRVDSHIAAEEGEIRVEPGQYIVEFDNSFSYLRSKTIWYAISVRAPLNNKSGTEVPT